MFKFLRTASFKRNEKISFRKIAVRDSAIHVSNKVFYFDIYGCYFRKVF